MATDTGQRDGRPSSPDGDYAYIELTMDDVTHNVRGR